MDLTTRIGLVSNSTPAGKARNRRVEVLKQEFPALYENVCQELIQRFELSPEEIF
ncbi:MAG: hypothetical protein ACI9ON_002412 [Limisphaerales bacterium]|jgi:hypothetical protein